MITAELHTTVMHSYAIQKGFIKVMIYDYYLLK